MKSPEQTTPSTHKRMFTIPNQSSVPRAHEHFEEDGRMKDSSYRDRFVDVMEELYKITILLRDHVDYLSAVSSSTPRRPTLSID